jgi:hypothetical protein
VRTSWAASPDLDEDAEGIATPARRFSVLEITSGLPDDSREADERAAEQGPRELRARVKVASAVVGATPGLAETLQSDWRKAARFYVGFGVTEETFRYGATAGGAVGDSRTYGIWPPMDSFIEASEQIGVVLPSSEVA